MRTAIIIVHTEGGQKVTGPDSMARQKEAFRSLTSADGHRAELWSSDRGIVRRKRLTKATENQVAKSSKKDDAPKKKQSRSAARSPDS